MTVTERRQLMHQRHVLLKRKSELTDRQLKILDAWLNEFEQLETAYCLKEMFFDLWQCPNGQDAYEQFMCWETMITPDIESAFKPLANMVWNWRPEIFTYFNMKLSNAYTESLNNLIRSTNRLGRGYSFAAIRAKMLFNDRLQRPKYERLVSSSVQKTGPTFKKAITLLEALERLTDEEHQLLANQLLPLLMG